MTIDNPMKPSGKCNLLLDQTEEVAPQPFRKEVIFMPKTYMSSKTVKNRMRRMCKMAELDSSLFDLSSEDLAALLFDSEQIGLSIRQELADRHKPTSDSVADSEFTENPLKSQVVHLDFNDGILHFFLPNTLMRRAAESWYIATLVEAQMVDLETENGIFLSDFFKPPIHIVVKRNDKTRKSSYRDNDNLEVSKIINRICGQLGFPDAADHVGYTSLFNIVSESKLIGTEIIVFESSKWDFVLKQKLF